MLRLARETYAQLVTSKDISCKFPDVVAPRPTFRAPGFTFRACVGHIPTPPLLLDHKQEHRALEEATEHQPVQRVQVLGLSVGNKF